MSKKIIKTVLFRRKREGKTNYKKRLTLLKTSVPRLVVRKSNKNIVAQVVKYAAVGDVVVKTASSSELKKYGWKANTGNMPSAYLVGLLLAKKSEDKEMVLDLGLQTPIAGSRLFAVVKGCIDGGLVIEHSEEILPSEDRIRGKHIAEHAKNAGDKFTAHPATALDEFDAVKNKIMKG